MAGDVDVGEVDVLLGFPTGGEMTVAIDGNPYVFGGRDEDFDSRATAEFYDGSSWVSLPDMAHARSRHTTVAIDGNPYVFGGLDENDRRATAEFAE